MKHQFNRPAFRIVATIIAVTIATSGLAQPLHHNLAFADQSALDRGEIALQVEKSGRTSIVDAAVVIEASPTEIWAILIACEIAPEYVPNVVACQSIDTLNDGASELFIQTVKPAFFVPKFEHVFRMDYSPHTRISINRISGPIRHLQSAWYLAERSDGHVVLSYHLELDPGLPIPRMFVRQTLRRDLPRVLSAIRKRAESASNN